MSSSYESFLCTNHSVRVQFGFCVGDLPGWNNGRSWSCWNSAGAHNSREIMEPTTPPWHYINFISLYCSQLERQGSQTQTQPHCPQGFLCMRQSRPIQNISRDTICVLWAMVWGSSFSAWPITVTYLLFSPAGWQFCCHRCCAVPHGKVVGQKRPTPNVEQHARFFHFIPCRPTF